MAETIRVCLLLEGSYPHITGGVSSWVHQIVGALPDIEFSLFTISPGPDQVLRYELPDNIVEQKDLDITKLLEITHKPVNKKQLMSEIRQMHEQMETGTAPAIDSLFEKMPDGYLLYSDAVSDKTAWEMITERNQRNNPIYAFADYFWAWKSAHDMMFSAIGASLPEADIYHAISTGYAGLAGVAAKIRRNKPLVLTEHGLYHKEREMEIRRVKFIKGYQRDMWIKIYNSVSRLVYRYSDLIISLFEYNRMKQIDLGAPAGRTLVIPNGIDTDFFAVERKPRDGGFHVGLVGRVVPIKDIKTFISACKIIADSVPDAVFYCIGPTDEDPDYYEDCKRLVESLKLSDCFEFTGRADVREYYAFLDAMLLTSVREAQPLVILEAYCAGVPVVSTKVGNVPELLDYDERFLAPSKDPEKLAAGVKFIHDNPGEMRNMNAKNREKVLRFYDRHALHSRYRDIYRDIKAGHPVKVG